MSEALLAASDTPGNRRELTYTISRVGDVYRDLSQPDKALEFFQRSLEIREALLAASDTPGNRRELTYTINRVGDVYRELSQPDKALEFFQRSLEIRQALLDASDTPGNRRELTYTINRVGDVYRELSQPDKALEFFQRSLEIRQALLDASDTPGNRRELTYTINRVGDVYRDLSQPDKALEFFLRSLEMSEALLAASDTPGNRRDVAIAIKRVGDVYLELSQPDKALEFFQRSYDLRKNMYHKYNTYQTLKDLLYCTETLIGLKRQLHLGNIAVRNQPWPPKLWKLFRENVWENLGEDMQEKLPEQFSCARIIREALAGNETATRPTLGFIIACCQYAQQPHLLYTFTDFRWWLEEAAAEQRQEEQLETLNRDQHQWGIRRTETVFSLKENPQVSDEITRGIEEGLTFTISLSLEEKQEIAQKYPELSSEQIQKLLQIFREEQIKSALQTPYHQLSLKRHSEIANLKKKASFKST